MPKYMFRATYTQDGVKGLLEEGGSGRRAVLEQLASSAGGSIEGMWWAFGTEDTFVVADLPNDETAATVAMTVAATGVANVTTTVLLTAEQMDAVSRQSVDYRPPGG